MTQLKFLPIAFAAFFAAVSSVSCSKTDSETTIPKEKQPLPVPSDYTVSTDKTTAEISWEAVAESEYYRCELFAGETSQGDCIFETTVTETVVLLENLTPGESYLLELYACPSEDSEEYTESEALSIPFTTETESVDFVINLDGFEEGEDGYLYVTVSWIPADKEMLYFPFMAQGELYDAASSDEEYIESYYETIEMMASYYNMTFEKYISAFLKTGDFSGASVIPQSGKYYAIAFGCLPDGTPITDLYKLEIIAE